MVVNVPNSYIAGDEGKVVNNGALVAQTARGSEITQNGTYDTTNNNSVTVNVSGGGSINWRDQLAVNWDFTNPVNTRGNSSYSTYGSSSMIYTIDGWQLQGGTLTFTTGGIKLAQYASGTIGYFIQRYKPDATTALVGRQCTLSVIVDGQLYYTTFVFNTTTGQQVRLNMMDDERMRIYRYGVGEIGVTVDITQDTGSHVLQAIKLETGSSQTLATLVNGAWVLNNTMDSDTEYIKARNGTVYNS